MITKFEDFSWHDNAIHGFRIVEGADGCSGQLDLDIDFIVDWIPPTRGARSFEFRVAPAILSFHDVTHLVISVDYASCSASLQPMSIQEIHREVFTSPNGYSSFAWKIEMNSPSDSFISFHAPYLSQELRAEPIQSAAQWLMPSQRPR